MVHRSKEESPRGDSLGCFPGLLSFLTKFALMVSISFAELDTTKRHTCAIATESFILIRLAIVVDAMKPNLKIWERNILTLWADEAVGHAGFGKEWKCIFAPCLHMSNLYVMGLVTIFQCLKHCVKKICAAAVLGRYVLESSWCLCHEYFLMSQKQDSYSYSYFHLGFWTWFERQMNLITLRGLSLVSQIFQQIPRSVFLLHTQCIWYLQYLIATPHDWIP